MSSPKTRTGARGAQRRPPARKGRDLPMLPLVVAGIFVVIFVALLVVYRVSSTSASGQPVANIRCDSNEQFATHYHAHLDIIYKGNPVSVPASIGIGSTCLYWTHTHDTTGVIHIEAPKDAANRKFLLGDFFKVWNQPLSKSQVATLKVGEGEQMKVWVDGQPYQGDPSKIELHSKQQIVIEIGPPFTDPPPTFTWDPNQYAQ